MNIDEILRELDILYKKGHTKEVENYLSVWLEKAIQYGDNRVIISLLNELVGFYRETGDFEKCRVFGMELLKLMNNLGMQNSIPYATSMLNVANALRAAGDLYESLKYYKEVEQIYGMYLKEDSFEYTGLYNNMALLFQELKDYGKAKEYLIRAIEILKLYKNTDFQLAVAYTNLGATLTELGEDGRAYEYLKKAIEIFERKELYDPHYCGALSAMSGLYVKRGQLKEAKQLCEKALRLIEANVGKSWSYERIRLNLEYINKLINEPYKNKRNIIDISREYYLKYAAPVIHEKFPEYEGRIAVGVCGEGSECLGFDDEISKDHDYGPGFAMWLTDEDYTAIGKELQKMYDELPKEFMGLKRIDVAKDRVGVFRISDFYQRTTGLKSEPETDEDWLYMAGNSQILTAVSGQVFRDDLGRFSKIRNKLKEYYPETVYRKIFAGVADEYSRSAQYNYARMLKRKDFVTAELYFTEAVEKLMDMAYLCEKKYSPYKKWKFRGLKNLSCGKDVERLINDAVTANRKGEYAQVEEIFNQAAGYFLKIMVKDKIIDCYLEDGENIDVYLGHYTGQIAGTEKQELIDKIVDMEFKAFDKVKNIGGRADCQDNFNTFSIMRKSQYMTWNLNMLYTYYDDFNRQLSVGNNMITEKYARMMESTNPAEYQLLKDNLPPVDMKKIALVNELCGISVAWMEEFKANYPTLAKAARAIHTSEDTPYSTSYETYLRGELLTYSDKLLNMYGRYIVDIIDEKKNLTYMTMENTVKLYGYKSLDDAEKKMAVR